MSKRQFRVGVKCENVSEGTKDYGKVKNFCFKFQTSRSPVEATRRAIDLLEKRVGPEWHFLSFPTITEIYPQPLEEV